MSPREQIGRGRLRAQIYVQARPEGKACIFCPHEIATALYRHLVARQIPTAPPVGAMFGRYPTDELIVVSTVEDTAKETTGPRRRGSCLDS